MNYIGRYDKKEVYQLMDHEDIPKDTERLYVAGSRMFYGGVAIGRLDLRNYHVEEYDMGIYHAKKRAEATYAKKRAEAARAQETEVRVPACVAETSTVGSDAVVGCDEFFAKIAKDIDELLANAGREAENMKEEFYI